MKFWGEIALNVTIKDKKDDQYSVTYIFGRAKEYCTGITLNGRNGVSKGLHTGMSQPTSSGTRGSIKYGSQ